ncbi:hypothetical protein Sp245p_25970 (plasmid) [Azospirillum baldaniorum]|uniref:Spore protein YkvP/CgeB glycosyl transferase-like domain-containing protein n=1 Tax=Azospirillum baldaniorum TaxID=1064539 RepID=A0A9P1NRR6_9PROT|nr:glycosyltransferase [Azospirillum baldaniorum]AWJ93274.1 hypothetical protein Sp245p_25970 [Azospirillum baldaniorum]TWA77969.1 hypothetical protein FBZ85_106129 [Azospirillum brasilense]CCD02931.1 protein of unknown function [Azospirillum baldaniorum]
MPRSLSVLYFACHETLEFDDLRMLTKAGHKVFSIGSFGDKSWKDQSFRGAGDELEKAFHQKELFEQFEKTGCSIRARSVTAEFCKNFDVVIVNHHPIWFTSNRDAFGDLPVVMRTIGQSTQEVEEEYRAFQDRVKIVRYSQTEAERPGWAKTDAVIYFGKYPGDYQAWRGGSGGLSFHNAFAPRNAISYPDVGGWQRFNERVQSRLFGAWNEGIPNSSGLAPHGDMARLLQEASYYFYIYTRPPSYTLSVLEAMMAGTPILAPSDKFILDQGCPVDDGWDPSRYEVPAFLDDGGGALYDTIADAADLAREIQEDSEKAAAVSAAARANAVMRFDAEKIGAQWNEFLLSIC